MLTDGRWIRVGNPERKVRWQMERFFLDRARWEGTDLGITSMRLIVSTADTDGAFAVAELRGGEGPWTVPHVHRHTDESFHVLEGSFHFTCGDREAEVKEGVFVRVPRGTRHVMRAGPGGGALLAYWVPGGLDQMFQGPGRLPAESIMDPKVRAEIAKHFDSIPA